MSFIFVLLFLVKCATCLPMPTDSNNPTSLAIPIIISAVLLALLLLIRFFWRRTGAKPRLAHSNCIKSCSDPSCPASTSFLFYGNEKATSGHSGFWVGFFGSPDYETRNACIPSSEKHKHLLNVSHLFPSCSSRRSRQSSRCSIVDTSDPESPALSAVIDTRALYNISNRKISSVKSHPFRIPSYPEKVATKTRRHSSLPASTTRSRSTSGTFSPKSQRHSSLKGNKSRYSSQSRKSTGSVSLRLVPQSPPLPPEFQPPLTPSEFGVMSPLPSGIKYSTKSSRKSRSSSSRQSYSLRSGETSPIAATSLTFASNQSHPYAIASHAVTHCNKKIPPRSPLTPITEPPAIITRSPTDCPIAVFPSPPVNYAVAIQANRSRPTRARQLSSKGSPSIGPSPLRNVVVTSEECHNAKEQSTSPCDAGSSGRNSPVMNGSYSNVGKGLPSNMTERNASANSRPASQRKSSSSGASKSEDNDAMFLLGILRELVEEASEWDESLPVNQNFKDMLDNSGISPSYTNNVAQRIVNVQERSDTSGNTSGSSDSQRDSANTSASTQVDLAMLDVQVYSGDPEDALAKDVLRYGSMKERAALALKASQLQVSFWDDEKSSSGPGLEDIEEESVIGLAC